MHPTMCQRSLRPTRAFQKRQRWGSTFEPPIGGARDQLHAETTKPKFSCPLVWSSWSRLGYHMLRLLPLGFQRFCPISQPSFSRPDSGTVPNDHQDPTFWLQVPREAEFQRPYSFCRILMFIYYTILYYTLLYSTLLYSTLLYYTIPYHTILHHTFGL